MEVLQRSKSAASAHEPARLRLLAPLAVPGMVLGMALVLMLIFPKKALIEQLSQQRQSNPLTVSYLVNLLRTEPDNHELRMMLVRQKMLLGNWPEARAALAEARRYESRGDARLDVRNADLLDYEIANAETFSAPEGSPARAAGIERIRQTLKRLAAYSWDAAMLQTLATRSVALGETKIALGFYKKIAASGARQAADPRLYAEAAKIAVGEGEYALAAELYFEAQDKARDIALKRQYFLDALKTLQSGNLLIPALEAAQRHIGELGEDDDALYFLARLAQAAGDHRRAEDYAKRLLRMVQAPADRNAAVRLLALLGDLLVPSAYAGEKTETATRPAGIRPFDEKKYAAAYDIFLAARSLENAYQVAHAAVAAHPDDLLWRGRLAQVSEWTRRSMEALQNWRVIAEKTQSAAAWQAVLRLAPGLGDFNLAIAAWKRQAETKGLTRPQWDALIDLYEQQGNPDAAIALLRRQYARSRAVFLLEREVQLLENTRRSDETIKALTSLIEVAGATQERVVKLATLKLAKGDFQGGFDALWHYQDQVPEKDGEFWRLLGDLAWRLQKDEAALKAYRTLAAAPLSKEDIHRTLIDMLRADYPDEAARLAESTAYRFKKPEYLVTALEIFQAKNNLAAMRNLLLGIPPEVLKKLEDNVDFLAQRAQYRQFVGLFDAALQDYRKAMALKPRDLTLEINYTWLLIDRQKVAELRKWLPHILEEAKNLEYSKLVSAIYLALNEPARAVPFLAAQAREHRTDFLWLVNYADTLELAGRKGEAQPIHIYAWNGLREQLLKENAKPTLRDQRVLIYARMLTRFYPGNPSLHVMRLLMRQDRLDQAAPAKSTDPVAALATQREDAQMKILALTWALSTEQNEAAKAWLWNSNAMRLAGPRWAEVPLALADNDLDRLNSLLESGGDIPLQDHIEAQKRLSQLREAQSLVFDAADKAPDDDALHEQYGEVFYATVPKIKVEVRPFRQGVVLGQQETASVELWLTPHLKIEPFVSLTRQHSTDQALLPNLPQTDRSTGISLLYQQPWGSAGFKLGQRSAMESFSFSRLDLASARFNRMEGAAALMRNELAGETSPLAAGGMKDQAEFSATYHPGRREYIRAKLWKSNYFTQQNRQALGSGKGLDWEAGHYWRLEYPDLVLRLHGSIQRYAIDDNARTLSNPLAPAAVDPTALFLPTNNQQYGISLGIGNSAQETYRRGWRPFANIGLNRSSAGETGHNLSLGASGSVLGDDFMSLRYENSRGGTNTTGDMSWSIWLNYRYLMSPLGRFW